MAERSRRAAHAMQRRHDAHVNTVVSSAGDDVWVYGESRDNKLDTHWHGPRRVISRVPESDVLYIVTAAPESGRDHVVVHVNHLRPCDASRLAESDRAIVNRRADTYIPERLIAHRGKPGAYEFLVAWRGWSDLRATWEPLRGRTVDGKPSGVGHVAIVQRYMLAQGLAEPAAGATGAGHRSRQRR